MNPGRFVKSLICSQFVIVNDDQNGTVKPKRPAFDAISSVYYKFLIIRIRDEV